jgi:hypothetical protein
VRLTIAPAILAEAGAIPDEITSDGRSLGFEYRYSAPTTHGVDTITRDTEACIPEFIDAVGRIWVSQGTRLTR